MKVGAGRRWLAAGLGALLLAGCTGVPTSSTPQELGTMPLAQPVQSLAILPQPGAFPRAIVQGFLDNNAFADHSGARAYLTPEEKNRWSDTSGTTVYDAVHVGLFNDGTDTVTVTGRPLGTINAAGVFTPTLQGNGSGAHQTPLPQTFGLKQVSGQWRISNVSYPGLLIDENQFNQYYNPRVVYFYDQAEQRLVPDLRYSPLTDPTSLATWLVAQLTAPASGSGLSTDLPSIPNVSQLKVSVGRILTVDLPGANQLGSDIKDRMAAQLALTLDQAVPNTSMQVSDGGQPVVIPQIGSATFDKGDFDNQVQTTTTSPALYFIHQGGLSDAAGEPVAGEIGTGGYGLTSVALSSILGADRLRVAATSGTGSARRLLLGEIGGTLHPAGLTGPLSRPAWMPDENEVWIGDGPTLYRIDSDGKRSKVAITVSAGTAAGRIVAVQPSPEGARVALVIAAAGGTSQIWIGTIARGADSVQVVGLHAISPVGVRVSDVGWYDTRKLYAIGTDKATQDPGVYETECDGSFWRADGIGDLPNAPDSLAVASGGLPAVSVRETEVTGETVWVQRDGTWVSPEKGTTYGTAPTYVQ
jgi:hypothetical protein